MCRLKKGNNTKRLPYMALVRLIFGYEAVCWDPYRGQVSALNWVQKRAAKFANNISQVGKLWHSADSPNMCPFQGTHQGKGLESGR